MNAAKTLLAFFAIAGTATPAMADWRWVDDGQPRTETYTYEERRVPEYTYEERRVPDYYEQQPRHYYRETYTPVVTQREAWRDGRCQVTRTYFSDGTSKDDRVCSHTRLLTPHEFFIDRMGRHFDHLRGYDRDY